MRHPGIHPPQKCIPRSGTCARTCAYTLQDTCSTRPTLPQILAGRTIWCERTSMVMLSFSCKKTEEVGLRFYQAASERPGSSQFMLCWRTLGQHLSLWRALISTASCWEVKYLPGMESYHSGCASAPAGTGEAKLPLPQGCCSASSYREREQWRRCGSFPVQEHYSRRRHRNLILLGYNRQDLLEEFGLSLQHSTKSSSCAPPLTVKDQWFPHFLLLPHFTSPLFSLFTRNIFLVCTPLLHYQIPSSQHLPANHYSSRRVTTFILDWNVHKDWNKAMDLICSSQTSVNWQIMRPSICNTMITDDNCARGYNWLVSICK